MSLTPDQVAMDWCHIELIAALVGANKPKSILEFGYGSGRLTRKIIETVQEYRMECQHNLVDNWLDWDGQQPKGVSKLSGKIIIIPMSEKDFIEEHLKISDYKFDFIISDADHHHSHEWWWEVYDKMLAPGGILIYHDVDGTYPGLKSILDNCKQMERQFALFNKSNLPTERCERGLLVIFKGE